MRCPKCQYLGFEPSPRCKNCGFDFAFGEETHALTLVADPEAPATVAEFDLQILDDAPARPMTAGRGFDLDELLATGRAASDPPGTLSGADAAAVDHGRATAPAAVAVATAVSSTPAPEEVERIVREAARVFDEPEPPAPPPPVFTSIPEPPRARAPKPAPPVTTELPLFMQGMGAMTGTDRAGQGMTAEALDAALAEAAAADGPTAEPVRPAPAADLNAQPAATADVSAVEADDAPLVRVPASPRAPLSVRRATPDAASLRAKYARPMASASGDLLRELETASPEAVELDARPAARLSAEPTPASLPAEWLRGAPAGPRLAAAAIDLLLLGAINASVLWLTLSVLGLQAADARLLPLAPIAVFFLLIDGGYLVLFTAACGQTLGKMAAGIRVVGTTTGAVINDRLSVGQALARTIGAIAASVPLGIGFWMGLFGDHRALHDRIAHTRVVRA